MRSKVSDGYQMIMSSTFVPSFQKHPITSQRGKKFVKTNVNKLKNSSSAILHLFYYHVKIKAKRELKKDFRMHGDLLLGAIFPQFGENEMLAEGGWAAIISRG